MYLVESVLRAGVIAYPAWLWRRSLHGIGRRGTFYRTDGRHANEPPPEFAKGDFDRLPRRNTPDDLQFT